MLAIEVDGNNNLNSETQIKDFNRQETIEKLGVIFIRFSDLEIKKNMNNVIRCLQAKIEELKE
jgi:very-short-patch-repair endonuclease